MKTRVGGSGPEDLEEAAWEPRGPGWRRRREGIVGCFVEV